MKKITKACLQAYLKIFLSLKILNSLLMALRESISRVDNSNQLTLVRYQQSPGHNTEASTKYGYRDIRFQQRDISFIDLIQQPQYTLSGQTQNLPAHILYVKII